MNRLFIIANHLPYDIRKTDDKIHLVPRRDGFSPGLKRFYEAYDIKWIGRAGIDIDEISENQKISLDNQYRVHDCIPLYLDNQLKKNYLEGFCENVLWPVFNYFSERARYENELWEAYEEVNSMFANEVSKFVQDDDLIWIHDYHLLLLPKLIKDQHPKVSIGYFQHIPFPSFEIFREIPWRLQLLDGMLGADLIGFHTYDYQRHFMSSVRRLMGIETYFNRIRFGERILKVDAFPKGIDFDQFYNKAKELDEQDNRTESGITKDLTTYFELGPDRQLILSIDRLDYTKGLPARLKAF